MAATNDRQPMSVALRLLIEHAEALPEGDVERDVRASAHALAAACMGRDAVERAVDRFAGSLTQLHAHLSAGTRRRHRHDEPAVQRLAATLRDELLPLLQHDHLL